MLASNLNPRASTTQKPRRTTPLIGFMTYAGTIIALLFFFFVAKFFLWAKCFNLRAFRVPSASMCPAICSDERIIAGMDAFNRRAPNRGEVILFHLDKTGMMLNKRVIGIAGDTIARGPSNTILVNNKPLRLPPPCGKNVGYSRLAPEGPPFQTVKVPQGSLFVIGDNLDESYDSRFFGFVGLDEVRGKALLIYWSSNPSRIGCRIQ
ncbi:MAG: signal peptidase I [Candidatus Acidiferrum sp.]